MASCLASCYPSLMILYHHLRAIDSGLPAVIKNLLLDIVKMSKYLGILRSISLFEERAQLCF